MTRMTRIAVVLAVAAAVVSASAATQPAPAPFWVGDFRGGDYCQFATVFEASSVNPEGLPSGYSDACSDYTRFARDTTQRVYLTQRPAPPTSTASRWVSHQELRTTDGPVSPGSGLAKATVRLTSDQTVDGSFQMGMERWFRFSIFLPAGFNWAEGGFHTLFDIHNDLSDPSGRDWPTISMNITPTSGRRRYVSLTLEGVSASANHETVKLLQLTRKDGARIVRAGKGQPAAFGRWHTLVLGVRFADDGTIGHSTGWAKVLFDGRWVYAKARPTVWKGERSVWLQLQNYVQYGTPFVNGARSSVVYFADARIGRTYASVTQPRLQR
jgi:hypothetical protein